MKNIAALLLLLVSSFAFAQFNIEDVVYLKSGSIIRGKITTPPNLLKEEQGSSSKISVELLGGSVFVFEFRGRSNLFGHWTPQRAISTKKS